MLEITINSEKLFHETTKLSLAVLTKYLITLQTKDYLLHNK